MMTTTLKTGVLAAAFAVVGGAAMAITIDTFDDVLTTGDVVGVATATNSASDTNPPAAGYVGMEREITATIVSTRDGQTGRASASSDGLGNDRFEFESGDNMVGSFELLYTGIGGLDLRDTPILVFRDTNNDAAFHVDVTLNGGASKSFTILGGGSGTDYALNLHNLAGIDAVTSLGILGTSQAQGGDISFDLIAVQAVPLPAALPLLLAGVGGLAALSRRKHTG